mgnify:FL=1
MIGRTYIALGFVFALWALANAEGEQASLPKVRQIFVVVCDGLTLQSLLRMGEPIQTLFKNSAVGLLSGSSLELSGRKGVFVSLGSGRRAKGNERAKLGKWLQRSGKSFQLLGNGVLEAIVGSKVPQGMKSVCQPDVVFIAAAKASLPPTLKSLVRGLDENSCLWLIVPNSPQTSWSTRRLTPILVFGKRVPSGLLTSPTTRKIGLVSSVDFAPTLLAQLGIAKPLTATGSEVKVARFEGNRLAYLQWLDERSVKPLRDLPALVFAMSAITAIALALVASVLLSTFWGSSGDLSSQSCLSKFLSTRCQVVKSAAVFAVLAGMSIPASLFFVTHLPHETGTINALQLLLLTCAFSWLALKLAVKFGGASPKSLPVSLRAAGLICALTAAVALLGVPLYWATPLGHYPTTGWRYFGITNSGIGLILAGTIFAWKLLSLPNRFIAIWLTLSPLLAGFSLWGANFGGALTLAIGFAASWFYMANKPCSWRKIAGSSLLAAFLTVIVLSVVESFVPQDQKAHWGQLLERIRFLGLAAIADMVWRKGLVLWDFFVRTPLNFVALVLFVAFHFGVAFLSRNSPLFTQLKSAFIATFVGSWAGLLLNDSGMEVVGMAMVIFGGVFLLALLENTNCRGDEIAIGTSS